MTAIAPSVLVIEDHAELNDHIAATLRLRVPGLLTLGAQSLAAAQNILRTRRVTAVWSDLGLPDAQGLATLQVVRTASRGAPVLVFSGSVELAAAVLAQDVPFFSKPAQFEQACDHVARLARGADRA